jgi:predicted nucleic acid-binding protein
LKKTGEWLVLFSELVNPKKRLQVVDYEPDNRILECAEAGEADFIISGDRKHLLKPGQYWKIKIVDAASFIKQFS